MGGSDDFTMTFFQLLFSVDQPDSRPKKVQGESAKERWGSPHLWYFALAIVVFTILAYTLKTLWPKKGWEEIAALFKFSFLCNKRMGKLASTGDDQTKRRQLLAGSREPGDYARLSTLSQFRCEQTSPGPEIIKLFIKRDITSGETFQDCKKRFLYSLMSPARQAKRERHRTENDAAATDRVELLREKPTVIQTETENASPGLSFNTAESPTEPPEKKPEHEETANSIAVEVASHSNVSMQPLRLPSYIKDNQKDKPPRSKSPKKKKGRSRQRSIFSKPDKGQDMSNDHYPVEEANNWGSRLRSEDRKGKTSHPEKGEHPPTRIKSSFQMPLSGTRKSPRKKKNQTTFSPASPSTAETAAQELKSLMRRVELETRPRPSISPRASKSFVRPGGAYRMSPAKIGRAKSDATSCKNRTKKEYRESKFVECLAPQPPSRGFNKERRRRKEKALAKKDILLSSTPVSSGTISKFEDKDICTKGVSMTILSRIASMHSTDDKVKVVNSGTGHGSNTASDRSKKKERAKEVIFYSEPHCRFIQAPLISEAKYLSHSDDQAKGQLQGSEESLINEQPCNNLNNTGIQTKHAPKQQFPNKYSSGQRIGPVKPNATVMKRRGDASIASANIRGLETAHKINLSRKGMSILNQRNNPTFKKRQQALPHLTKRRDSAELLSSHYSCLGCIAPSRSITATDALNSDQHLQKGRIIGSVHDGRCTKLQPIEGYILNSKTPIANTLLLCRSGITTTYENWARELVQGPGTVKACSRASCSEKFPSLSSYLDHLEKTTVANLHYRRPPLGGKGYLGERSKGPYLSKRAKELIDNGVVYHEHIAELSPKMMCNGKGKKDTRQSERSRDTESTKTSRIPEQPNRQLKVNFSDVSGVESNKPTVSQQAKSTMRRFYGGTWRESHKQLSPISEKKENTNLPVRRWRRPKYQPFKKLPVHDATLGKKNIASEGKDSVAQQKQTFKAADLVRMKIARFGEKTGRETVEKTNIPGLIEKEKETTPFSETKTTEEQEGKTEEKKSEPEELNQQHTEVPSPVVTSLRKLTPSPGSTGRGINFVEFFGPGGSASPEKPRFASPTSTHKSMGEETSASLDLQSLLEMAKAVLKKDKNSKSKTKETESSPCIALTGNNSDQVLEVSPCKSSPVAKSHAATESETVPIAKMEEAPSYTHLYKTSESRGIKPWRTTKAFTNRLKLILQRNKETCVRRKVQRAPKTRRDMNTRQAYVVHKALPPSMPRQYKNEAEVCNLVGTGKINPLKQVEKSIRKASGKLIYTNESSKLSKSSPEKVLKHPASGPPKLRTEALAKRRRESAEVVQVKPLPVPTKKKKPKSKGTPLVLTAKLLHEDSKETTEDGLVSSYAIPHFGLGENQRTGLRALDDEPLRWRRPMVGIDPAQAAKLHQDALEAETTIGGQVAAGINAVSRASKVQSELSVLLGKIQTRVEHAHTHDEGADTGAGCKPSKSGVMGVGIATGTQPEIQDMIELTKKNPRTHTGAMEIGTSASAVSLSWKSSIKEPAHEQPQHPVVVDGNAELQTSPTRRSELLLIHSEPDPESSSNALKSLLQCASNKFYSMVNLPNTRTQSPVVACEASANIPDLPEEDLKTSEYLQTMSDTHHSAVETLPKLVIATENRSSPNSVFVSPTTVSAEANISNSRKSDSIEQGNAMFVEGNKTQDKTLNKLRSNQRSHGKKQSSNMSIESVEKNTKMKIKLGTDTKNIRIPSQKKTKHCQKSTTSNTSMLGRVNMTINSPKQSPTTVNAIHTNSEDENVGQTNVVSGGKTAKRKMVSAQQTASGDAAHFKRVKTEHCPELEKNTAQATFAHVNSLISGKEISPITQLSPKLSKARTDTTPVNMTGFTILEDKTKLSNAKSSPKTTTTSKDGRMGIIDVHAEKELWCDKTYDTVETLSDQEPGGSSEIISNSQITSSVLNFTDMSEHEVFVFSESIHDLENQSSKKSTDVSHSGMLDRAVSVTSGYCTADGSSSSAFSHKAKVFARNNDALLSFLSVDRGSNEAWRSIFHSLDCGPGGSARSKGFQTMPCMQTGGQVSARKVLSHITEESDHSEAQSDFGIKDNLRQGHLLPFSITDHEPMETHTGPNADPGIAETSRILIATKLVDLADEADQQELLKDCHRDVGESTNTHYHPNAGARDGIATSNDEGVLPYSQFSVIAQPLPEATENDNFISNDSSSMQDAEVSMANTETLVIDVRTDETIRKLSSHNIASEESEVTTSHNAGQKSNGLCYGDSTSSQKDLKGKMSQDILDGGSSKQAYEFTKPRGYQDGGHSQCTGSVHAEVCLDSYQIDGIPVNVVYTAPNSEFIEPSFTNEAEDEVSFESWTKNSTFEGRDKIIKDDNRDKTRDKTEDYDYWKQDLEEVGAVAFEDASVSETRQSSENTVKASDPGATDPGKSYSQSLEESAPGVSKEKSKSNTDDTQSSSNDVTVDTVTKPNPGTVEVDHTKTEKGFNHSEDLESLLDSALDKTAVSFKPMEVDIVFTKTRSRRVRERRLCIRRVASASCDSAPGSLDAKFYAVRESEGIISSPTDTLDARTSTCFRPKLRPRRSLSGDETKLNNFLQRVGPFPPKSKDLGISSNTPALPERKLSESVNALSKQDLSLKDILQNISPQAYRTARNRKPKEHGTSTKSDLDVVKQTPQYQLKKDSVTLDNSDNAHAKAGADLGLVNAGAISENLKDAKPAFSDSQHAKTDVALSFSKHSANGSSKDINNTVDASVSLVNNMKLGTNASKRTEPNNLNSSLFGQEQKKEVGESRNAIKECLCGYLGTDFDDPVNKLVKNSDRERFSCEVLAKSRGKVSHPNLEKSFLGAFDTLCRETVLPKEGMLKHNYFNAQDEAGKPVGNHSPCRSSSSSIVLSWVGSQAGSENEVDFFSLVASDCPEVVDADVAKNTDGAVASDDAECGGVVDDVDHDNSAKGDAGAAQSSSSCSLQRSLTINSQDDDTSRAFFNLVDPSDTQIEDEEEPRLPLQPSRFELKDVVSLRKEHFLKRFKSPERIMGMSFQNGSSRRINDRDKVSFKTGLKNSNENKPRLTAENCISKSKLLDKTPSHIWLSIDSDSVENHSALQTSFEPDQYECEDDTEGNECLTDSQHSANGVLELKSYLYNLVRNSNWDDDTPSGLWKEHGAPVVAVEPQEQTTQSRVTHKVARGGYVISAWANQRLNTEPPSQRPRVVKCQLPATLRSPPSEANVYTGERRRQPILHTSKVGSRKATQRLTCKFVTCMDPQIKQISSSPIARNGPVCDASNSHLNLAHRESYCSNSFVAEKPRSLLTLEEHLRARSGLSTPGLHHPNNAGAANSDIGIGRRFRSLDEHLQTVSDRRQGDVHREPGNAGPVEARGPDCYDHKSPSSHSSLNWYRPQSLSSSNSVRSNSVAAVSCPESRLELYGETTQGFHFDTNLTALWQSKAPTDTGKNTIGPHGRLQAQWPNKNQADIQANAPRVMTTATIEHTARGSETETRKATNGVDAVTRLVCEGAPEGSAQSIDGQKVSKIVQMFERRTTGEH